MKVITQQLKSPNDDENHAAIRLVSSLLVSNNPDTIDSFLYHGTLDALNCLLHD